MLLATTPERKELLSHQAEGHGHAPALAGKQRGFFRPRGGALAAPAPSSQDKQLEGTVD